MKKALAEVATLFPGLSLSSAPADGSAARAVRVISIKDVQDGSIAPLDSLPAFALQAGPLMDRCRVRQGDVLVTCRGTQLKIAPVRSESAEAVASSNLIVVRPGPKVLSSVLLAFLLSPAAQAEMLRGSRSSAGSIALSASDLGRLLMPVPPLGEQRRIVQLLEAVETGYRAGMRAAELRRQLGHELASKLLFGKP